MAKEKVMFRDLTIQPTKGRKPIILNKLLITLEKKVTVESSHTSLDSDQIIIKISGQGYDFLKYALGPICDAGYTLVKDRVYWEEVEC